MRIWILEIGEPLPLEPDVRLHRYGQFAPFLASQGHDVTWWTSSFSHAPKKHLVDRDQDIRIDGYRLRVIAGGGYARNVSLARIRHNHFFAKRFTEWAQKSFSQGDRPDLILAPVPTIESALAAIEFGRKVNVPVMTDIRDLWPDELRDLAPTPLRWLTRLMLSGAYRKMRRVCESATGVMGVSDDYLDFGLRFAERTRTANDIWFPLGYADQKLSEEKFALAQRWLGDLLGREQAIFTVCFFGTIGKYFDLDTVIAASHKLEERGKKVRFILAGDGSSLEAFRGKANEVGDGANRRIFFPGWVDYAKIRAIMQVSDVGLAPYATHAKMSLPNKPFEYMAGGLAILSSIQGQLKVLLAEKGIGLTYQADSVSDLVAKLEWLMDHQAERVSMSQRARQVFENEFTVERIFLRVSNELERIVSRSNAH